MSFSWLRPMRTGDFANVSVRCDVAVGSLTVTSRGMAQVEGHHNPIAAATQPH